MQSVGRSASALRGTAMIRCGMTCWRSRAQAIGCSGWGIRASGGCNAALRWPRLPPWCALSALRRGACKMLVQQTCPAAASGLRIGRDVHLISPASSGPVWLKPDLQQREGHGWRLLASRPDHVVAHPPRPWCRSHCASGRIGLDRGAQPWGKETVAGSFTAISASGLGQSFLCFPRSYQRHFVLEGLHSP